MSRHSVPSTVPNHKVIVGWDAPLQTFFATVENLLEDDEEKATILWVGARPRDTIATTEELQDRVKDYASIPQSICSVLEDEKANSSQPSSLQRMVKRLMDETA